MGPYQKLLPLAGLLFCRVDLTDLYPLEVKVRIVRLLDGDTLVVGRGNRLLKVRLSKIDAPEKGQRFLDGSGDAGRESKKCVAKLISKEEVLLKYEKKDFYGRILGDVDGLNLKTVESGCVSLYPHAQFESYAEKFRYLRAYSEARREGRGLWKRGGYMTPKLWRKRQRGVTSAGGGNRAAISKRSGDRQLRR